MLKPVPFDQRLAAIVRENPSGCWTWPGHRNRKGYGVCNFRYKAGLVHRFAFELTYGPVPPSKQLDHLCKNKACFRPDHLEMVDQWENMRRRWASHCARGHALTGDNLWVWINPKTGYHHRYCLTCKSLGKRERIKRVPAPPAKSLKSKAWTMKRTHCRRGHEFAPENTYLWMRPGRGTVRACRECQRRRD